MSLRTHFILTMGKSGATCSTRFYRIGKVEKLVWKLFYVKARNVKKLAWGPEFFVYSGAKP